MLEVYCKGFDEENFGKAMQIWKQFVSIPTGRESLLPHVLSCCDNDEEASQVLSLLKDSTNIDILIAEVMSHCLKNVDRCEWLYSKDPNNIICKEHLLLSYSYTGVYYDKATEIYNSVDSKDKTAIMTSAYLSCSDTKEQAMSLYSTLSELTDEQLSKSINLCRDNTERAELLYSLCRPENSQLSDIALLDVYAKAGNGPDNSIRFLKNQKTKDATLLGLVYAACATAEQLPMVTSIFKEVEQTPTTIEMAVSKHYFDLTQEIFDHLDNNNGSLDEACCQALLKAHADNGGQYTRALAVYKELYYDKNITPSSETIGCIAACCSDENELEEVFSTVNNYSWNQSISKAISITGVKDVDRCELFFSVHSKAVSQLLTVTESLWECPIEEKIFRIISDALSLNFTIKNSNSMLVSSTDSNTLTLLKFDSRNRCVAFSSSNGEITTKYPVSVVQSHSKKYNFDSRSISWICGDVIGSTDIVDDARIAIARKWLSAIGMVALIGCLQFLNKEEISKLLTSLWKRPKRKQRHSTVLHSSLQLAYQNLRMQNTNVSVTRADILNDPGIGSILKPVPRYFDNNPARLTEVVSWAAFISEVSQHQLEPNELPSTSRRQIANKFLGNIVSELDAFGKEKVHDWLTRAATDAEEQISEERGLLLGTQPAHIGKEGEETDDLQRCCVELPQYDAQADISTWQFQNDMVQPLFLRVGGIPILGCTYVQTFETKADKALKRRLQKIRREQDALGLLLPDDGNKGNTGGRLYTLMSIKNSISRARKRKGQAIFYKTLLNTTDHEHSFNRNSTIPETPEGESKDDLEDDASSSSTRIRSHMEFEAYDPNFLDDPEIKSEKKRKQLAIPSLRATVIPYSKSKDLKEDVNQQFLLTHPWIEESGLSLTGIRKCKMIMINLALQDTPRVEASTIAYAVVYFEKLILKQIVTKENRKLVASSCIVLAYKFWESPAATTGTDFTYLLSDLEDHFDVPRKRVLSAEFKIYALLNFDLLIPKVHAIPHFERLLALYNITSNEYLSRKDGDHWNLALREEGTAPVVKLTNQ